VRLSFIEFTIETALGVDEDDDNDNDDDDDDDDDDGTDTGTLEVKRGIKLKSARTWLWSFKGYEELIYNF